MRPPSSNGSGNPVPHDSANSPRSGIGTFSALDERLLAIQTTGAPDVLVRISVLVSRRGATVRSALSMGTGGEGSTLVIVVAGAPRTLSRLPLWIAGLPDVDLVTDLSPGAASAAHAESTKFAAPMGSTKSTAPVGNTKSAAPVVSMRSAAPVGNTKSAALALDGKEKAR